MAVLCGSPRKRFTKEFREAVYNINPINITCTYKEIFEVNAVSKLRNLDYNINFLDSDDRSQHGNGGNTNTSNTWATVLKHGQVSVKNLKTKNGYLSDSETVFKTVRRSSSLSDNPANVKIPRRPDRRHSVVSDGFHGWKVCSRPHTAACSDYRILSKSILNESHRIRSRSASAKINYSKLKRAKFMSEKRLSGRHKTKKESPLVVCSGFECNALIEDENLTCPSGASINDSSTGSTSNLSTYSSSVSTDQSVPIPFYFKHYDYYRDYMDQYRKQYTYQKLDEYRPTSPPMTPPPPQSIVPSTPKVHLLMPPMPLFHWIDPITSARRVFPAHDVSESSRLFGSSPPPTRKKIAKAEFSDEELKSPHFLLAQNGVLKMEFFTNPLNCLERPSKPKLDVHEKSPVVCRSRPTIPSNAHGNIYPSATETQAHVVSSVKIRR